MELDDLSIEIKDFTTKASSKIDEQAARLLAIEQKLTSSLPTSRRWRAKRHRPHRSRVSTVQGLQRGQRWQNRPDRGRQLP